MFLNFIIKSLTIVEFLDFRRELPAYNTKTWIVNSIIPINASDSYYCADFKKTNKELLARVIRKQYVTLHGPRASGKSTRAHVAMHQLMDLGFTCF